MLTDKWTDTGTTYWQRHSQHNSIVNMIRHDDQPQQQITHATCTDPLACPLILIRKEFQHISSKSSPTLDNERWAQSWSRFLGSQPADDLNINPVVDCRWFPPARRLLSQPERSPPWPAPNYTAWWQRHTGVSSLPKATVQWCPARTRTHDLHITSPLACRVTLLTEINLSQSY